jgi:hypothetical protein
MTVNGIPDGLFDEGEVMMTIPTVTNTIITHVKMIFIIPNHAN